MTFTVTAEEKANAIQTFESFSYPAPITQLLKKYFKFDLGETFANIQKSHRYQTDRQYEFYQLTKEQVELKFHVSLQRGILFHSWIEFKLQQRANNSNSNEQQFDLLGLYDTFDRFYTEIICSTLGWAATLPYRMGNC